MSTHQEILQSYMKQTNLILTALQHGEFDLAILASNNLTTYLKVKVKELGENVENTEVKNE